MSFLTCILLVTLCVGSCVPQMAEDLILNTLESIAARQDSLLQKIDEQETKSDSQQIMMEELKTKIEIQHTMLQEVSRRLSGVEDDINSTKEEILSKFSRGEEQHYITMTAQFSEQETKLDSQQTMMQALEDKLLVQHEQLENLKLSTKHQISTFHDLLATELENLKLSTKHQISTFHDLLATDECDTNTNNCSIYATCRDSPIHFECSCMAGYSGDGVICEDVDECKADSNLCGDEEVCINVPGNYTCIICQDGFVKQGDICQDIDECSAENKCSLHASCTNTRGGYTCQCAPGREGDGYTCKPNGFVCTSPNLQLEPFGCVKYLEEEMSWSDAQAKCNADGGSLLYGFTTKQQLITIVQHVSQHFLGRYYGIAWVGVRGGLFIQSPSDDGPPGETSSITPPPPHLWDGDYGQPRGTLGDDTQCGLVSLFPSNPELWDSDCSSSRHPSLCQILY